MRSKKKRGPVPVPPEERFNKYVNKKGELMPHMDDRCWEWEACFDVHGHPVFGYSPNVAVKAHRYSYELKTGKKLKKRKRVERICKNPKCVRASHIKEK